MKFNSTGDGFSQDAITRPPEYESIVCDCPFAYRIHMCLHI